uniref:PHD-type zinc finger protein n=1 Tax=Schistosoma japonicum TaxID=6182 RepID=E2D7Y0_SCHJA|nr:PHD-type zinc finger protein [Schistosoma japonicum]
MGLCKCERRRVTNLFCFEHRVNVCEFCLVANHNKQCIVKSYLRWIKDSDFNPSCSLCHELFETDPTKKCVRLVCLDVFHWDCLNNYVLSLPPTTTPAGFLCPLCDQPIIPQANHGGPVAEALRTCLSEVSWAKESLTQIRPFFPLESYSKSVVTPNANATSPNPINGKLLDPRLDIAARQFLKGRDVTDILESPQMTTGCQIDNNSRDTNMYADISQVHYQRRDQPLSSSSNLFASEYDDNDKYKRSLTLTWFKRFLRRHSSHFFCLSVIRRNRLVALIMTCIICIFLLGFYGSQPKDITGDPLLDPHMNPNIHFNLEPIDSMKAVLDNPNNDGLNDA